MKGKLGIVIGLAAGYVLGSRAGRERYNQIKEQVVKLWETEPVQKQVDKVKDFSKDATAALPSTLWNSAVKVTKAATGKGTPGEKLDSTVYASQKSADDISKAAQTSADAFAKKAESAADDFSGAAQTTGTEVGDAAEDSFDDIQKAAREHDGI